MSNYSVSGDEIDNYLMIDEDYPSTESVNKEYMKNEQLQKSIEKISEGAINKKDYTEHTSGAQKDTKGKLRMDLIPPEVLEEYAKVLTIGVEKYSDRNWEKGLLLVEHHLGAAFRHINKWQKGEDLNVEKNNNGIITSKENHMTHALWHIAAIVTQISRGRKDLDDRVKL